MFQLFVFIPPHEFYSTVYACAGIADEVMPIDALFSGLAKAKDSVFEMGIDEWVLSGM